MDRMKVTRVIQGLQKAALTPVEKLQKPSLKDQTLALKIMGQMKRKNLCFNQMINLP